MRKLGTELSEGVGTAETASEGDSVGSGVSKSKNGASDGAASEGDSVGSEDSAGVGAALAFSSALTAEIAANSAMAKRVWTFMILFYGKRSKVCMTIVLGIFCCPSFGLSNVLAHMKEGKQIQLRF